MPATKKKPTSSSAAAAAPPASPKSKPSARRSSSAAAAAAAVSPAKPRRPSASPKPTPGTPVSADKRRTAEEAKRAKRAIFESEDEDDTSSTDGAAAPKPAAAKGKAKAAPKSPGRPKAKETPAARAVRAIYKTINSRASFGGNGAGGPMYGENTEASMQKVVELLKEHAGLDAKSKFIDVGSGLGKPNFHVAADPGVALSYGIECETNRWLLAMNCLAGVLHLTNGDVPPPKGGAAAAAVDEDAFLLERPPLYFAEMNINKASTFDPFTHVYMFDLAFEDSLMEHLAEMFNTSDTTRWLLSYLRPEGKKGIIGKYGFNVELVAKQQTSMHGSGEGHTAHLYKRLDVDHSVDTSKSKKCDKCFKIGDDLVKGARKGIVKSVEAQLEASLSVGRVLRPRKARASYADTE